MENFALQDLMLFLLLLCYTPIKIKQNELGRIIGPTNDFRLYCNPKSAHVFWKGYFGRKNMFSLKSFLSTTRTNWKTYVWLDGERNISQCAREQIPKLGFIVKPFKWETEIIGTPFETFLGKQNPWDIEEGELKKWNRRKIYADWVRLVVLYKYGGLYFDLDTLFIKPIEDVISKHRQFVTTWHGNPRISNNCLMFFYKDSPELIELVHMAVKEKRAASWFGFKGLTRPTMNKNIDLVHSCYIDYCWGCKKCNCHWIFYKANTTFESLYKEIYRLSYVYHWHNAYFNPISSDSYFTRLEKGFDEKLGISSTYSKESF